MARTGQTIHWSELAAARAELGAGGPYALSADGRALVGETLAIELPAVLPATSTAPPAEETARERAARLARRGEDPGSVDPLDRYLESLPAELPSQCVILCQAGATALGYFRGGEPLATKSFKRYVVRGKGRAQPTHLKSKGKSRYGARLRLQNAKSQLAETNERLHGMWAEFGPPRDVFVSAPKRLWADLCRADPPPPDLEGASRLHRVRRDVRVPTTAELLRVYRSLQYATVERTAP